MKNQLKRWSKQLLGRLPVSLPRLIQMSGQPLLMPVYHLCSDRPVPHIHHLYPVHSNGQFRRDMETLLRYYEPIDLPTVVAVLRGEQTLERPSFWLSFDDGLREVKTEALPILQALGIPATLFLNNAFLDNRALFFRFKASLLIERWQQQRPGEPLQIAMRESFHKAGIQWSEDRFAEAFLQVGYAQQSLLDELATLLEVDFAAYLQERQPYLTRAEVKEVLRQGHHIGAHSWDHPLYHQLPLEAQLSQTQQSVEALAKDFALEPWTFAFPFTDFGVSWAWFERSHQAGLQASFGSAGLKHDRHPHHGQRFPMEGRRGERLGTATQRLRAEYLYFLMKQPLGKNVIERR